MNVPKFFSCEKKFRSREETILNIYRDCFQAHVPEDRQYWTICSYQTDESGGFSPTSELGQMVRSGLIKSRQFVGVDIGAGPITANRSAIPEATWVHGNLLDVLQRARDEKWLRPSIVNVDTMRMKNNAAIEISDVLALLTDVDYSDILVTGNIMLSNPNSRNGRLGAMKASSESEVALKEILATESFKYATAFGPWWLCSRTYAYDGTGRQSVTTMATFIFVKSESILSSIFEKLIP